MVRNLALSFSLAVLVLLSATTTSCGSSGSGGGGGGGGGNSYNVVGPWVVSFSSNIGPITYGYGVINSSGVAAFFDAGGNMVKLPSITGANSFSGNLTAYAVNGTFFPGAVTVITDTAQGNVNSASSITGVFSSASNSRAAFSVVPDSPLNGSVVPVSGALNGRIVGFVDSLNFTFASNGTFTGTDSTQSSACALSGTLTQEATNNVFDITMSNVSGCLANTQTGIGFESSTDYFGVNGGADASYLYIIMLTATASNVSPAVYVIYQ